MNASSAYCDEIMNIDRNIRLAVFFYLLKVNVNLFNNAHDLISAVSSFFMENEYFHFL